LIAVGFLVGAPWAGLFAAVLLGLQGDWLFHARFFSFDAPFVGFSLAAVAAGAWAQQGSARRWWLAGLCLALAAWSKSWFVLALAPAWAAGLSALPAGQRRGAAWRLLLPPLAALLLWVLVYAAWNGWGFFSQEWSNNLLGRALGRTNELDPEGHWAFYRKWAWRSAPLLLLLALPVSAGLALQRPPRGVRRWLWALALAWILSYSLGLALVRAETINYLLPLEAALALAALALAAQRLSTGWQVLLVFVLSGGLGPEAWRFLRRPLDPQPELAPLLAAHAPADPSEPLLVLGPPTQAVEFYARQRVIRLPALPDRRPPQAVLVKSTEGWRYFPPQTQGRP
jgi:hypothetical protein